MWIRIGLLQCGGCLVCRQLRCIACLTLPSPCNSIYWPLYLLGVGEFLEVLLLFSCQRTFFSEQKDSFSSLYFSNWGTVFILEEWRNLNAPTIITKLWRLDPKPSCSIGLSSLWLRVLLSRSGASVTIAVLRIWQASKKFFSDQLVIQTGTQKGCQLCSLAECILWINPVFSWSIW